MSLTFQDSSDSDAPLIKVRAKKNKVLSSTDETCEQSPVCESPKQTAVAAAPKQTGSGATPEQVLDNKQKKTQERLVNPNHLVEKKVAASSFKEALNKLVSTILLETSRL